VERASLRRQERYAVLLACIAGGVAGSLLAVAEISLYDRLHGGLSLASSPDELPQLSRFLAVTLVVSVTEILFLYWNALRMATHYASCTGLGLLPDRLEDLRTRSVARAALELPDPRDPVYGIDPFANVPWWRHWTSTLLYRLKVGTTNFVLRALVRRVVGRTAVRFFVPLLAVPVFIVWNGLITWWALRQARIRAFGALAVRELLDRLEPHALRIGHHARRTIVEAVGEVLIRKRGAHPNLVVLLTALVDAFDLADARIDTDWEACRARCATLNSEERRTVIDVVTLALVIDGRPGREEQQILRDVTGACGHPFPAGRLERLREAITQGQGLGDELVPAAP
jgi:hypothetical protein